MAAKKGRRTAQRSSKGTQGHATRDARGALKDIQDYARTHSGDLARLSRVEAQAAAERAAKALHQAESAFQGAVHRVEEMIQVGRREFANMREAAKDALARLLASTQRSAQAAAGEAQTLVRRAGRSGPERKARGGVKKATKAAPTAAAQRGKAGGKARGAKGRRKG
jgi:hypothetical protein